MGTNVFVVKHQGGFSATFGWLMVWLLPCCVAQISSSSSSSQGNICFLLWSLVLKVHPVVPHYSTLLFFLLFVRSPVWSFCLHKILIFLDDWVLYHWRFWNQSLDNSLSRYIFSPAGVQSRVICLNINKSNFKICFQILFKSFRLPLFLMLWLSFLNVTHHFCLCFTVYIFFPSFPSHPLPPSLLYLSVTSSLFSTTMAPLSHLSFFVFLYFWLSLTRTPLILRSAHPHSSPLNFPWCSPILWIWRKVLR